MEFLVRYLALYLLFSVTDSFWWFWIGNRHKNMLLMLAFQTASPSAHKNRRIVLVPCHVWMCDPTAIFGGINIFKGSGCHLL